MSLLAQCLTEANSWLDPSLEIFCLQSNDLTWHSGPGQNIPPYLFKMPTNEPFSFPSLFYQCYYYAVMHHRTPESGLCRAEHVTRLGTVDYCVTKMCIALHRVHNLLY